MNRSIDDSPLAAHDFVLVTNTFWGEAPRIRHQVARLLRNAGGRVLFLERPARIGGAVTGPLPNPESGIWLGRGECLLHHQLRVVPPLHHLDAWVTSRSLAAVVDAWKPRDDFVIINFAPDAFFLSDAFPGHRIVTIIHDDFEAQSRLPWSSHIRWSLERTCRQSDHILAVSEPLVERLSNCCSPELLLPWTESEYRVPSRPSSDRRSLLFWGFVDTGLDLEVVEEIADHLSWLGPEWRLLVVGPTQGKGVRPRIERRLLPRPNVEILGPHRLDQLPIDDVLAAVLPYRRSRITDAVTLANKSMQLLANGLPLLISAMPRFVRAPFVIRLDGPGGVAEAVRTASRDFDSLQPVIERFCTQNSAKSRLATLTRACGI